MEVLIGLVLLVVMLAGTVWLLGVLWPLLGPLLTIILLVAVGFGILLLAMKTLGVGLEILANLVRLVRLGWARLRTVSGASHTPPPPASAGPR